MQELEPARVAAEQLREETTSKAARIRELETSLAKMEQQGRDEAARLRAALSTAESAARCSQVRTGGRLLGCARMLRAAGGNGCGHVRASARSTCIRAPVCSFADRHRSCAGMKHFTTRSWLVQKAIAAMVQDRTRSEMAADALDTLMTGTATAMIEIQGADAAPTGEAAAALVGSALAKVFASVIHPLSAASPYWTCGAMAPH